MFILFIKRLLIYTISIFLLYLCLENITINVNDLIDGLFKSLVIAFLLVPITLLKFFPKNIAYEAKYCESIEIETDLQQCFKQSRMILKTMNDIKLIDSKEFTELEMESEYSCLKISLNEINSAKTKIDITSTPKIYNNINDYNKYQKDLKNVITAIYVNLDENRYYSEYLKENSHNFIEDFKPNIILYYRLIKVCIVSIFVFSIFLFLYSITISTHTSISIILFFAIIALYLLFAVLYEIDSIINIIICPACKNKLIKNKVFLKDYILPYSCKNCGIRLL